MRADRRVRHNSQYCAPPVRQPMSGAVAVGDSGIQTEVVTIVSPVVAGMTAARITACIDRFRRDAAAND